MNKGFQFLAICVVGVALATSSIAWAQTYTAVDFPGAALTEVIGGPNPQARAWAVTLSRLAELCTALL
jgi:hypothetical protein